MANIVLGEMLQLFQKYQFYVSMVARI